MTPNTNCLFGMACPQCQSDGLFHIEVRCIVTVYDDGVGDTETTEWQDNSVCGCSACGHSGTVARFTIENWGRHDTRGAFAQTARVRGA